MIKEDKEKGIIVWRLGYDKSRQKAKDIYSKIGSVKCPALKDELVAFNRIGFDHLLRKGRTLRSKNEQKRRFALLKYAESIVTSLKIDIEFRKSSIKEPRRRFGNKAIVQSDAYFWTLVTYIDGVIVRVVIRQVGNGQKHFFSIMGREIINRSTTDNTNNS